jgi:hypothetical protein
VAAPLVCPACGTGAPLTERFCAACGSPLVHAGAGPGEPPLEHAADERRIYARKVHPPYAEGELVRVAGARHLAEAELIQGLLLEAGVPSMTRRARGFDVPDFLAAGPRDVMVPLAGMEPAREVLLEARLAPASDSGSARPNPLILIAAVLGGGGAAALIAWLLLQGG